jgi:hypothetical protein
VNFPFSGRLREVLSLLGGLCGVFVLALPLRAESTLDVAATVRGWPDRFELIGSKTEPTWVEHVRLMRRGDVFILEGGGLAGGEQTTESVEVTRSGTIRHLQCPAARDCSDASPLAGFLASAQVLASLRAGLLKGSARVVAYGERHVFCLPAEAIGVQEPILDPCFDVATGAVLAQRDRIDGSWGGPSLDKATLRFGEPVPAPQKVD